ncbi:hypothetical protein ACQKQD_33760 [Methylobacterium sp. NPDC080182]|uniref:hypothetical protein n=1 Tax=Methylobacterium sp. NPDC080182 TaxID=3390590 RepID=UPI003CFD7EC9
MYILKSGIKKNPGRRWALPDRIFFGYGACHILAGAYLERPPLKNFYGERIVPFSEQPGNHIYVTDGVITFDYHGYSLRERLLSHHSRVWLTQRESWICEIVPVDFDLLSTTDLNERKMLGPDQYLHDAVPRARAFIERRDHAAAAAKARSKSQWVQVSKGS